VRILEAPEGLSGQSGGSRGGGSSPSKPREFGGGERVGQGARSESFDPESTLVRPHMRIISGPSTSQYLRPLKHDDVVVVPEFFCKEDDWSIYRKLVDEISSLQAQGANRSEWIPWHNGCHSITKEATGSPTFATIIERICEYFTLDRRSVATRFNLYRDGSDWKPFHHDSAAFNPKRAETQNLTVGISFGRERELAFLHVENRTRLYFPQTNGMLFSFGRDVNISWKHGVNALPADERGGDGRISIIVWGTTNLAVEEEGSPAMLQDRAVAASPLDDARSAAPSRPPPAATNTASTPLPPPQPREEAAMARGGIIHGEEEGREGRQGGECSEGGGLEDARGAGASWLSRLSSTMANYLRGELAIAAKMLADYDESRPRPGPGNSRACGGGGGSQRRQLHDDPWQSSDPWSQSASSRAGRADAIAARRPRQDCWAGYVAGASPNTTASGGGCGGGSSSSFAASVPSDGLAGGFFEVHCGCSRDEYLQKHIDYGCQEAVRGLRLSDQELFRLGKCHFQEQREHVRRVEHGDIVTLPEGKGGGKGGNGKGGNGKGGGKGASRHEEKTWWDDDDVEENPFWWRGEVESLCFDLPMTPEVSITAGAPPASQWWDVQKLAESDHFVAVCKPAGMFVVTDQRGLWEESPTNFIHVAHRRFEMPSATEPRQRGICHRLDSHTSGVQIFGKSWEAFRHFTTQNSNHRMQKEYIALVIGRVGGADGPHSGLIDVPMKKWQDFSRREFGSVICANAGLPAVTKYKVLRHLYVPAKGMTKFWGKARWFSLVQLRIMTGRTHQIRVHMAFIGHPLVGDVKYNPKYLEEDYAVVPRIFLHCLRMEFEDRDGSTFVASSDLASDLQVALNRLQSMAEAPVPPEVAARSGDGGEIEQDLPAASLGFPGLADLLRRTPSLAAAADAGDGEDGKGGSELVLGAPICRRCLNCGFLEEASCSTIRRGAKVCLNWRLVQREDNSADGNLAPSARPAAEAPFIFSEAQPVCWGPGALWVPSELQQQGGGGMSGGGDAAGEGVDDATPEELGQHWGAHSAEWAWAHDGLKQNGWLHLRAGKTLTSKWGPGQWRLLEEVSPPLLLVCFNDVEHLLRLEGGGEGPPGFEVMAKRRLQGERSLAEDIGSPAYDRLLDPCTPPCCATRGWPSPGIAPRRAA